MTFDETVRKALEQIRKRPANHDYFFSKLNSPEWIEPLAKEGLFARAPSAIHEGNTISFPFWPESQYLERMASSAPEQVVDLMLKLPDTDNVRVHEDLAQAAIKLPAKLAAKWADKEARWVRNQAYLYFTLPEILGKVASRLARDGEPRVALKLARALLSPRADQETSKLAEPKFRFDAWHYERVLREQVVPMLESTGLDGLRLLLDTIEDALTAQGNGDDGYSWLWRPAIEAHEQNHRHGDMRNALVDAARDAIALLADGGHGSEILDELNARKRPIFRRLALHMLADRPDESASIREAISKANFSDVHLWHEYGRLLRAVFPRLNEHQAAEVLGWIEEGPPVAETDDKEAVAIRKATWQLRRLSMVREYLPPSWKEKYGQLVALAGGEPSHPDFLSFHSSWAGPISPKNESELEAMPPEAVAEFLKNWKPDGTWRSPEPEGLARVLQSVVAKSPARFVAALRLFREVQPTYARAMVMALSDAAKEKVALDWVQILDYVQWVVSQPRSASDPEAGELSRDPHWGWARRATAALLSVAFQKDALQIELRRRAWDVLEPLTSDPDPTPKDDLSNMDPATLSINTTRGEAMHAVVQYALAVHRSQPEIDKAKSSTFDFSLMPEVRQCLERHLDPAIDPSPAIRSVYGQWIPWLVLMDPAWVKAHMESIFPASNPPLRNAAWDTYLTFCHPYDQVFQVLRAQYEAAVERMNEGPGVLDAKDFVQASARLGEHLMALAGRGLVSWDAENQMLKRFFERAPVESASQALAFVGRSLHDAHESMTPEIVRRFCRLWDSLSEKVLGGNRSANREVLKAFGSWFGAPSLDPIWAFERLNVVLNAAGDVNSDYMVVEKLKDLANGYPSESLTLLRKLLAGSKDKWAVLAWDESIKEILRTALDAEETREQAVALVHELGARGYMEFRGLLPKR